MIKAVKLSKKHIKAGDLQKLLRQAGLVNEEEGHAHPDRLWASRQDLKTMRAALKRYAKKQYPGSKKAQDSAVGLAWLQLSPNESLADALKPGFFIVDSLE